MGDIEDAIKEHEERCREQEQVTRNAVMAAVSAAADKAATAAATAADKANGLSDKMGDIHGLFFGTVDRPRNGLIMAVDKNTSFRTWMMKVVVSGGILTLIGAISKHLFF